MENDLNPVIIEAADPGNYENFQEFKEAAKHLDEFIGGSELAFIQECLISRLGYTKDRAIEHLGGIVRCKRIIQDYKDE